MRLDKKPSARTCLLILGFDPQTGAPLQCSEPLTGTQWRYCSTAHADIARKRYRAERNASDIRCYRQRHPEDKDIRHAVLGANPFLRSMARDAKESGDRVQIVWEAFITLDTYAGLVVEAEQCVSALFAGGQEMLERISRKILEANADELVMGRPARILEARVFIVRVREVFGYLYSDDGYGLPLFDVIFGTLDRATGEKCVILRIDTRIRVALQFADFAEEYLLITEPLQIEPVFSFELNKRQMQ